MRKVILNMNEKEKYEIIKSLVEHNGNKDRAAIKLGCTKRHVNRFIQKYKQFGESAFVHGNKGRKPAHTISEQMKTEVIIFPSARHPWRSETFLKHRCHKLTDKMLAS